MERDLNCTQFQATLGISLYALGFGIVPLVTASFSEEFGRQPLYLWSGVGFLLFTIATAVCVCLFLRTNCRFSRVPTEERTFRLS